MADVSAKDVAALRKATGAGMMDCKQALVESDGDLEKAMDWLREKGLGKAGKLSEREATEGAVEAIVDGNVGVILELNCNTDFVAKSADFRELATKLADLVAKEGDADVAARSLDGTPVADVLAQMAAKLGENVSLGRIVRYESDGVLDAYKHIQHERGTIGVLVEITGVSADNVLAQQVAHDVALHASFSAPQYLTRDEVPAEVVEREKTVIEGKSRNEGVPEDKLAGAVTGRINGFYKEIVLTEQASVKDPKVTIAKLVAGIGDGATLARYARVKVGED